MEQFKHEEMRWSCEEPKPYGCFFFLFADDDSRVKLRAMGKMQEGADYINASYVDVSGDWFGSGVGEEND